MYVQAIVRTCSSCAGHAHDNSLSHWNVVILLMIKNNVVLLSFLKNACVVEEVCYVVSLVLFNTFRC